MAGCGATVVVAGRRLERLETAAAAIGGAGGRAQAVVCDVRDPAAVEAMVTAAEEAFGPVSILVNNAGATFTVRAEDLSPNGFRSVVETDAFGTFYVCQAVGRRLIAGGGGGAVRNITSTSPYTGNPGRVHGGVGKAGVESLTKSLAVEWGPYGIRVNSLAPGYTPTAGVDRATGVADDAEVARRAAAVPLGRVGRLTDIVWPAVFLLSPAASYITGASLVVDGARWLSTGRAPDQTVAPPDKTHGG